MYPWLAPKVSVYAPLGPDVLDYLGRVHRFNSREQNPTRWELDVHLAPDPMRDLLRERPGEIVVFAGRNRGKIDRILEALDAGLNVLADKPWIIRAGDLPKVEQALALAERRGLVAYDIMTERFEATSELQRELVNDPEVFGTLDPGSSSDPGVRARSVHHIMKLVAGAPLRRPPWFFDIEEYGEGLADVGTHVVDLVQWTASPDTLLDYRRDIHVVESRRWQLTMTKGQFSQITGEKDFPAALGTHVREGVFDYFCNNSIHYTLRGVHVKLEIAWDWEARAGAGDVYEAAFRGTKSSIEIRQGEAEKHSPELYVVPRISPAEVFAAVRTRVAAMQTQWPGLEVAERDQEVRLVIPERFRVGHEAHFAQVANRFSEYLKAPGSMPAWERGAMLAKYFVSTHAS